MFKKLYLLLIFISYSAMAVNIQQFSRSNSLVYERLEGARLRNSHVNSDYRWIFTLGASHVDTPLSIKTDDNSEQLGDIITDLTAIHFGGAYWINQNLSIGFRGNYSWFSDSQNVNRNGLGDIRLEAKWRFYETKRSAFSFSPNIFIPTNSAEFQPLTQDGIRFPDGSRSFISNTSFTWGGVFAYERLYRKFSAVLNLGYFHSDDAIFDELDKRDTLTTGIGFYIPITHKWGVNLEWQRQWTLPLFNGNQEPNEFYTGARWAISRSVHGFAGLGLGNIFDSNDGNDYRASLGVKWIPKKAKENSKKVNLH